MERVETPQTWAARDCDGPPRLGGHRWADAAEVRPADAPDPRLPGGFNRAGAMEPPVTAGGGQGDGHGRGVPASTEPGLWSPGDLICQRWASWSMVRLQRSRGYGAPVTVVNESVRAVTTWELQRSRGY